MKWVGRGIVLASIFAGAKGMHSSLDEQNIRCSLENELRAIERVVSEVGDYTHIAKHFNAYKSIAGSSSVAATVSRSEEMVDQCIALVGIADATIITLKALVYKDEFSLEFASRNPLVQLLRTACANRRYIAYHLGTGVIK